MTDSDWLLGADQDGQSVTPEWDPTGEALIAGVVVRQVKHVVASNGVVTELYRQDWETDPGGVQQVFLRTMVPGGVSAWHAHAHTTDRLFAIRGRVRLVLFDAREDSETRGLLNVFDLADCRPALVVVPPRVWHGLANTGGEDASVVNIVDHAYSYTDPDHWRLPQETDRIPYRFADRG